MRRLLPAALLAALAIAGCGSASSQSAGGSTSLSGDRQAELSYFPAGAPLIASATTDPKSTQIGNLTQLLSHFGIVSFGEQELLTKLKGFGLNYQTDVKPLLGDPISIGFGGGGVQPSDVLIVWMVADQSKLQALLAKTHVGAKTGTLDGATVYSPSGATLAVDGNTLILGLQKPIVEAALQRHAANSGFSASEYQELLSGLPSNPLIQIFGDLRSVLAQPSAAQAHAIPWVGAIKGYGVALNTTPSTVNLNFKIDTTGATLTDSELPLATGTTTPGVAGTLPITVGLANPSQAIGFILQAVKAADPSALASVPAIGVTAITALQSQLTGTGALASDGSTTMVRAQLTNASQVASEIQALLGLAHGKGVPKSLGGGFYQDGSFTFGIADGQLLIGKASAAQLTAFATAPTSPVSGASGSVVFRVALLPVLRLAFHNSPGIVGTVLSQFGQATGSVQVSPSALTGQATVTVH